MSNPPNYKPDSTVFKHFSLNGPASGIPGIVESNDGKISRIRPYHYDKERWKGLNTYKIEARGSTFEPPQRSIFGSYYMTYKKRVYSNNRVRYPLKRVDWDPKGDRHPENRGKSKYVRISWEEAADLIADEMLRIREKYGMSAVLAEADMHGEGKHVAPCHGCMNRLLAMLGGYTVQMRNEDSWEGWYWGAKHVWGSEPVGEMEPKANLWPDIAKHSDMVLMWSADPEVTAMGFDSFVASRMSQWLKSIGIKLVYIDPALNFSACYQADKWIPVLPNTDSALYLAVAYVWLTEKLYDREYVETHCVGYDEFFDYVLGKADGVPKDPKWASEKCGVPTWTIKAFARDWASKTVSIGIGNGGPTIRGPFCSEPGRLQPILLAMQGLGKPGVHQAKWLEWSLFSDRWPMPFRSKVVPNIAHRGELVMPTPLRDDMLSFSETSGWKTFGNEAIRENMRNRLINGVKGRYFLTDSQLEVPGMKELNLSTGVNPQQAIPKCMLHDAILNGHVEWYGLWQFNGPLLEQFHKFEYPMPGQSRIHAIWTDSPCMTTCWNDGFKMVKAFRDPSIEFIVAQHPWLENDCYMADIILPVATHFEMDDICEDRGSAIAVSVFRERPACPPVGESLDDFDCVAEVARKISEKLGDGGEIYNRYTGHDMPKEQVIESFWQASGVADMDTEDDFHNKDMFVIPADPMNETYPAGLYNFYMDPEKYPLTTPTGKLEFTSETLRAAFPDDAARKPYPTYVEKTDMHDESFSSERAKTYPMLLMSNHGRWRFHANCDDITWNREVSTMKIRGKDGYQYEPAWINTRDAKERGIEFGDIVKIYNERGTVLCGAYVTERLNRNTVYVDHGSRFDPIDAEKLDRGGAINLISPDAISSKYCCGMVVSGYLVQIEKVSDEEMEQWRQKYPDSFGRTVDEACGVCLDGWMIDDTRKEQ